MCVVNNYSPQVIRKKDNSGYERASSVFQIQNTPYQYNACVIILNVVSLNRVYTCILTSLTH